jgi:hypothetical protein
MRWASSSPHSPYFGPGLLAKLQLMSLRADASLVEVFYMNRAACLWRAQFYIDEKAGDSRLFFGPVPFYRASMT